MHGPLSCTGGCEVERWPSCCSLGVSSRLQHPQPHLFGSAVLVFDGRFVIHLVALRRSKTIRSAGGAIGRAPRPEAAAALELEISTQ
ncbi:hypothetical protein RRG08_021082 [Elysia crispata]|uniref:Uncharacterized protein n=1 Tax=Elysia crispata TaxID=231223 RepID=A0AAE0YDK2_9GAST|nr:hypothetical protein RRG08_021082 [Elysia crispata]